VIVILILQLSVRKGNKREYRGNHPV